MTTTPTAWKTTAQVNTTDAVFDGDGNVVAQTQCRSAVIGLAGGGYIVAWEDNTDRFGLGAPDIIGQRYDASGAPVEGEFVVSQTYNDYPQVLVDLAAFSDGSFIGAYQTTGDPLFADGENVTVERFGADGDQTGLNDFRGAGDDTDPTIATFKDDSYALVYVDTAGGASDLTFVQVDPAGVASAGVVVEDAVTASAPEIAVLSNDGVALAYNADDGMSETVRVKVLTAAGMVVASDVAGAHADESGPEIAALATGFVVVWTGRDADGPGNRGVVYQLYDNDGVPDPVGPRNAVTLFTNNAEIQPSVVALPDGGFMIAWREAGGATIEGQRFSASGAMVGDQLALVQADNLFDPQLSLLDDGRFIVTATNLVDGTFDEDVVSAIWDPRDTLIGGSDESEIITSRRDGAALTGGGGADSLYGYDGADTLIGGRGDDLMSGGAGNDTFYVQTAGDTVSESGGIDTIHASVDHTLAAGLEVEFLRARGPDGLDLTGNALANRIFGGAGRDSLSGEAGADRLYAFGGADTLDGGAGDDALYVRTADDVVVEAAGDGRDIVWARGDWTITAGQEIEYLRAQSDAGLELIGNEIANAIVGAAGDDTLVGGGGRDTLTGGAGADHFEFRTALSPSADRITDFVSGVDVVGLDLGLFGAVTGAPGATLSADQFKVTGGGSGGVVDVDDRLIYDADSGMLYYDQDGSGAGRAAHVATFAGISSIAASDFQLV